MNEEQQNNFAEKIINGIAGFFKAKNEAGEEAPKAAEVTLENGEIIYHEGELAEGIPVFTDAEMTNALADGDYVLSDNRVMTVAAGIVEVINEAEPANKMDESLVIANAEIERLKGELEAIKNAKDTTIKNLREKLATVSKKTPAQNHAGDTTQKPKYENEINAFKALKKN